MITSAAILLIIFLIMIPGGIFFTVWGDSAPRKDPPSYQRVAIPLGVISAILGFVFAFALCIIFPILYFNTAGNAAGMEAFYDDTLQAFEYTVDATEAIEISSADAGVIDVAYLEQGKATSERLAELRDKVDWYNAKLQWFERFNGMWLADGFVADLPDHLKPIHLED